jgi:hypothetical protein
MMDMDLILCDFCQRELTSEFDHTLHLDQCHPNWAAEIAAEMATELILKNYNRKPRKQQQPKQSKTPRVHYVFLSGKLVRVEDGR